MWPWPFLNVQRVDDTCWFISRYNVRAVQVIGLFLILSWFWVDDWWLTIDHSSSADFGLDPKRVILNFAAAFQAMLRGFAGHSVRSLRSLTRQCAIQKIWWNCGRGLATEADMGRLGAFFFFFWGGGREPPTIWMDRRDRRAWVCYLFGKAHYYVGYTHIWKSLAILHGYISG